MNIAIRVNATTTIGSGHFYRCLEIAKLLKSNKHKIYFICDEINHQLVKKIKKLNAYLFIIKKNKLNKKYEDIDSEQTIKVLKKIQKKIDLFIVDSYLIGVKWEKRIKKYVNKIFIIDDLDRKHTCDFYLNQNIYIKNIRKKLPKKTHKFLGLKFCILKYSNFDKKKIIQKPKKIKNILIFMGGSDRMNLTYKILKIFSSTVFKNFRLHIVIGINNKKISLIKKISKARGKCKIYHNLPSLKSVLFKSDIAISSGGTFIWECIFFGMPTLVINQSRNQINNSKILDKISAIKLYKNKLNNLEKLKDFLKTFLMKQNFKIPNKIFNLIDGKGKFRVVQSIKKISNEI